MRETGIVTSTNKNRAKVKVDKKSECSKCGMCLFPKGADSVEFEATNNLHAEEGDAVVIENRKDGKLLGAMLAFFVPLVLILVAWLISYYVIKIEIWMLILSVIFIILWYTILAMIDKSLKNKGYTHDIVLIVKKGEKEDEQSDRNNL